MGERTKVTRSGVFISGEEGGRERRAGCHRDGLFKPSVNGQADSQARSPLHKLASEYFIVSSSVHFARDFLNIHRHLPSSASPVMSIFPPCPFFKPFFSLLRTFLTVSASSSLFISLKASPSCRVELQHSLIPRSLHSGDSCIGIKAASHLQTHSLLYGLSSTHHLPFRGLPTPPRPSAPSPLNPYPFLSA